MFIFWLRSVIFPHHFPQSLHPNFHGFILFDGWPEKNSTLASISIGYSKYLFFSFPGNLLGFQFPHSSRSKSHGVFTCHVGCALHFCLEPRRLRWRNMFHEATLALSSLSNVTQVSYPLEYIPNVKIPAVGGHPKNIIMLWGAPAVWKTRKAAAFFGGEGFLDLSGWNIRGSQATNSVAWGMEVGGSLPISQHFKTRMPREP